MTHMYDVIILTGVQDARVDSQRIMELMETMDSKLKKEKLSSDQIQEVCQVQLTKARYDSYNDDVSMTHSLGNFNYNWMTLKNVLKWLKQIILK